MFSPEKIERRFTGIAVSRGIGIGKTVYFEPDEPEHTHEHIDEHRVADEIHRLEAAITSSTQQLRLLAADTDFDPSQPVSGIFAAHLSIIEDSSFVEQAVSGIEKQRVNAEWAIRSVADHYRERQIAVLDDRFKEKHLDIEDVAGRILAALSGAPIRDFDDFRGAIVVARELRPSAILELSKHSPAAIVTERGGWTSHSAILAREFHLPMVSGVKNIYQTLPPGNHAAVDAYSGEVIIDPNDRVIKFLEDFGSYQENAQAVATDSSKGPVVTLDDVEITIRANTDIVEGYKFAEAAGASGIGLFRSESLIRNRGSVPSEDEQFESYSEIAGATGDRVVRIRTFDTGAGYANDSTEQNGALGLRAIRLSLLDQDIFRTQVRAILRASASRKIDLVLPMISGVGEITRARAIIEEEKIGLSNSGIEIGSPLIGAMIEVPSAVVTIDQIAHAVDFLCLGTNDLVQYLLAVDRDNDAIADWYQSLHPAVTRSISRVLEAGAEAGKTVTVCGEMAGSPFYVPLLIGLGARDLSININSVKQIRRLISGILLSRTVLIADAVKTNTTSDETENFLREFYTQEWSDLFPTGLLRARHR